VNLQRPYTYRDHHFAGVTTSHSTPRAHLSRLRILQPRRVLHQTARGFDFVGISAASTEWLKLADSFQTRAESGYIHGLFQRRLATGQTASAPSLCSPPSRSTAGRYSVPALLANAILRPYFAIVQPISNGGERKAFHFLLRDGQSPDCEARLDEKRGIPSPRSRIGLRKTRNTPGAPLVTQVLVPSADSRSRLHRARLNLRRLTCLRLVKPNAPRFRR